MSSKTHIRFITAIGFCYGVAEVMERHYKKLDGRKKIKAVIYDLKYKSLKYVDKFNKKLKRSEIKSIERKIAYLVENGLEESKSYQEYVSLVCLMLSDLYVKLKDEKYGQARLNSLNDLLKLFNEIDKYYSSRIRHDRFNIRGSEQYEKFLEVF